MIKLFCIHIVLLGAVTTLYSHTFHDSAIQNPNRRENIIWYDEFENGELDNWTIKDNYYCFLHSSQRRITCLGKRVSGVFSNLDECKDNGAYCNLSLALSALHDTLVVYLNDKKILNAFNNDLSSGKIGFMSCSNAGLYVDYAGVYDELIDERVMDYFEINK